MSGDPFARMRRRLLTLKLRQPHGHPTDGEEIRELTRRLADAAREKQRTLSAAGSRDTACS